MCAGVRSSECGVGSVRPRQCGATDPTNTPPAILNGCKNYEDTLIAAHESHKRAGLPVSYMLVDSWWYGERHNGGYVCHHLAYRQTIFLWFTNGVCLCISGLVLIHMSTCMLNTGCHARCTMHDARCTMHDVMPWLKDSAVGGCTRTGRRHISREQQLQRDEAAIGRGRRPSVQSTLGRLELQKRRQSILCQPRLQVCDARTYVHRLVSATRS